MPLSLADINIRDPFLLVDRERRVYHLYGTDGPTCWGGPGKGFDVWRSRDLVAWEGPFPAFRPAPGFWGTHHFWAPEVHQVGGRFAMLATFKADGVCRGTQVLWADDPLGPFVPQGDGPLTPRDWECLDGTLYQEPDGQWWLVFCHEWLQVGDGRMSALPLAADLSRAVGSPIELFRASAAAWTKEIEDWGKRGRVTDGPFLARLPGGGLTMIWSSHGPQGYALGQALSAGGIRGPWRQQEQPLFSRDGGHGMLAQDLAGRWLLPLHSPNETLRERPVLLPVELTAAGVRVLPGPAR